MKRIINVDMEVTTKNIETALNRFFKKYPLLTYWKETFKYMYENNQDFFCDNKLSDGTKTIIGDMLYTLTLMKALFI